jgi:hypothetical protein
LLHDLLKHRSFMALACCQDKGHRFALALGSQMDLGTEAALRAA